MYTLAAPKQQGGYSVMYTLAVVHTPLSQQQTCMGGTRGHAGRGARVGVLLGPLQRSLQLLLRCALPAHCHTLKTRALAPSLACFALVPTPYRMLPLP